MSLTALEEWEALSEAQREGLMADWDIYGQRGYWVHLFEQGVDELRHKFEGNANVTRIFSANRHGRLEICVETLRGTPSLQPGWTFVLSGSHSMNLASGRSIH